MQAKRLSAVAVVMIVACSLGSAASAQTVLKNNLRELPVLGHRNWIVVADSAYPSQTSPGVKTIYTGGDQIEVVREVLAAVDKSPHVRGNIFLDAEMPFVPEKTAPGIDAYRRQLKKVLGDRKATSLPHEEIIAQLDEAGQKFHVLVLKTDLTVPYTTVFLQLDCGYWSAESEQALREAMRKAGTSK